MAVLGVEVRVCAQAIIHSPAHQCMDWAITVFAKDIPTRDFKPAKRAHHGKIRPLCEAG